MRHDIGRGVDIFGNPAQKTKRCWVMLLQRGLLLWLAVGLIHLSPSRSQGRKADPADAESSEKQQQLLQEAQLSIPEGSDADKTLSPYFFVKGSDPQVDSLPLQSTRTDVQIAGVMATVLVTQVYKNEGKNTLEAVYIFPASTRAAVYSMKMTIGARVIEAEIKKREEARKEYQQALSEGKTASLLEQQRPNVFQMNVGNILPRDEIKVELTYAELLVPDNQIYEFVYPTVVGPRYSNRKEQAATDQESWVQNPYLHQGRSAPYSFGLDADIQSGIPIGQALCPSHQADIQFRDQKNVHIRLADGLEGGNRDVILRYSLAGDRIESGLLLYPGAEENFFLLMMEPPLRIAAQDIVLREYIFIMDVSGSMGGNPIEISKNLMRDLVSGLRPDESFNLLLFSGGNALLSPQSLPASSDNIRSAMELIERQQGGGGTELLPALQRALALPKKEGVSRIVVLATDGYVDVEKEAFELIQKNLGQANLFAFGIGTSVNRYLIEGLARAGMGEPFVVLKLEQAGELAKQFREYVSSPLMQGIKVEFEGFDAYDVEPAAIPDLFAARPVMVFGKYKGEAKGRITVRGHAAAQEMQGAIDLGEANCSDQNQALRYLWARHRIMRLSDLGQEDDGTGKQAAEVTDLGLRYHLLTQYTSFVAVDTQVRADGKTITTVHQPLPLPSGVSDLAVGGHGLLGIMGRGTGGGGYGYAGVGASASAPLYYRAAPLLVSGSLSHELIRKVVEQHRDQIRFCYAQELTRTPALQGKIDVHWTIKEDGTIDNVTITSDSLNNDAVTLCIIAKIKTWKFPKVKGGGVVEINYPFIFKSK